jgi:hypothetical protein
VCVCFNADLYKVESRCMVFLLLVHRILRQSRWFHFWLLLTQSSFCLSLSYLPFIYVTLYFLCPCKLPYALPGARQGINIRINIVSTCSESLWLQVTSHCFLAFLAQSAHKIMAGLLPCTWLVPRPVTQLRISNSWLFLLRHCGPVP